MAVYRYDRETGRMVDKETGEPMNRPGDNRPLAVPVVRGDLPGYQSPVSGEWIEGSRARRADLDKHNCIDAREVSKPKKLKNERFARKHGLEHLLG